nr:ubiquinone biosynthesis protein UbiD [Myxococcota bacterium]
MSSPDPRDHRGTDPLPPARARTDRTDRIVVLGASGLVGRRIVTELVRTGAPIVLAGRRAAALEELADGAPVAICDAGDPASL